MEFLVFCRAAPATQAKRVRAIDRVAIAAGHPPVQRTPELLTVLRGGRPAQPTRETFEADGVEAALRALPSHGWTAGWFGRRDRALIVLSQIAGLPYRHIAQLRAGDVTFADDGAASIQAPGNAVRIDSGGDPSTCPPCALARWLHVLDLAGQHQRLAATYLASQAEAVNEASPHRCRIPQRRRSRATAAMPLLPPSDRWGSLPSDPAESMSAHSLSSLTRSHGRGHHPDHWNGDATWPQPSQSSDRTEPSRPRRRPPATAATTGWEPRNENGTTSTSSPTSVTSTTTPTGRPNNSNAVAATYSTKHNPEDNNPASLRQIIQANYAK